jgi:alkylation response protein AidB-like acyl-CoA dehydrogenase
MIPTLDRPTLAAGADPLAVARSLAPELSDRAREAETLGTMPPDLVARIRATGLFRALQPRALGGFELEPARFLEVVEELARADGSAGWTTTIGAGGSAFAAWLEPGVAVDLFGRDADFTSATVFAPTGRATPAGDDGFTVEGRWPFASGCRHAEWFVTGVFVMDGDAPRLVPDCGPDWRLVYFPSDQGEIVDNWDVMGLRATGSNDIAARALHVGEAHTISPFFEPARHDGPLWRFSFFTLAGVALVGVPLGIARRALDEVTELAVTKVRGGSFQTVAEDPAAQVELARAEAGLGAARAFVLDELGSLWSTACAGDAPSVAQRARFQLATNHAMCAAVQAVDVAMTLSGAGAIRGSEPLQRCFRDVHTVNQHAYFSTAALKRYANDRFGIAQPTFML